MQLSAVDSLIEKIVTGMSFECVDIERSGRGMLRVFIDSPQGITVDDCALVSNQLTRAFAVEGVDFDRLEVSSPGLDRPLKKPADFERFLEYEVKLKVRVPRNGQRNFVGQLVSANETSFSLLVEGTEEPLSFEYADIERAHLVPEF
ncbi:ribosome maturation factor RimP [Ferrovum sp. PN-J185]|uniref:ribosome maturation factor RimP n=1 Tax=Ferrovum sp. PN-J185 TaxID=1356306 RepID=UPI000795030E|nr:ribosome maturation factor RimP [Ferrovum sp. PN-J185]KXW55197.1 ribosome maturation factor RimP [Ferrovum sp. PN-J185]MCC6069324.1 ribosome maturation factor RimP [Ferrovum sp. PN-J185]